MLAVWSLTLASAAPTLVLGGSRTCLLDAGVATCWGSASFGSLPGSTPLEPCGTTSRPDQCRSATPLTGLPKLGSLALSYDQGCGSSAADGAVWCFGNDRGGAMAAAGAALSTCAEPLGASPDCVLDTSTGAVKCSDAVQPRGVYRSPCAETPVKMGFAARDLFVGGQAICGTTPQGLRCWGLDDARVLVGSQEAEPYWLSPKPAAVSGAPAAITVDGYLVLEQGEVRELPSNGSPEGASTVLRDASALTANQRTACAIVGADRTAKCWGSGIYGTLGAGPLPADEYGVIQHRKPIDVLGLRGVSALRLSDSHACARLDDGSVWCWGANALGQLGLGDTAERDHPVKVGGLPPIRQIELGSSHTCALDTSSALWCWGSDLQGQVRGSNARCRPGWIGETEDVPCQTVPRRVP